MNKHLFTGRSIGKASLLFFYFSILSFYIVYEQATSCLAIDLTEQLVRHQNMLSGKSEFFNPWQYRIFSTYVIEGIKYLLSLISMPSENILPFLILRFLQNIAIFYVAFIFYKALKLESNLLIIAGLLLLGYNMSNSVFMSDLSINTYFDILFYLIAGYCILKDKTVWILPLILMAAFNRETSGFIPLMVIFSSISFEEKRIYNLRAFRIGIISLFLFILIFVALRYYYGMPTAKGIHDMTSPMDFFKFNITFLRMYPQLFGTLGVIPVIVALRFKDLSHSMKLFLILIVPIWFLIHFFKSQAMETRLFLVPQALIFIPSFLQIIERELRVRFESKPFRI